MSGDTGPWSNYLLVIAVIVIGCLGLALIGADYYVNRENPENIKIILPLMLSAIITIVSLAYGITAKNEVAKLNNLLEKSKSEERQP